MVLPAIRTLLLVALFGTGAAVAQVRDIPAASWVPIFFESIDDFTRRAGWKPLRDQSLGRDSIEVRVWIGFGIGPLEVVALRRHGDKWEALYGWARLWRQGPARVGAVTPKSGWQELWARLTALGLLTLPDASRLPRSGAGQSAQVADGTSYVVEINTGGRYRTYMYSNPEHADWPEARHIAEIARLLGAELIAKGVI